MVSLIVTIIAVAATPALAHHELGAPAPVVLNMAQVVIALVGAVGLEGAYRILFRRK